MIVFSLMLFAVVFHTLDMAASKPVQDHFLGERVTPDRWKWWMGSQARKVWYRPGGAICLWLLIWATKERGS